MWTQCTVEPICGEEIRDSQINKCTTVVVISSCQIINSLDMLKQYYEMCPAIQYHIVSFTITGIPVKVK